MKPCLLLGRTLDRAAVAPGRGLLFLGHCWLFFGLIVCGGQWAMAEIRLPKCFSDHMVLQRERPLSVWGWEDAGTEVTVSLGGTQQTVTANAEGKFLVTLDAMQAGGPHELMVKGTTEIVLKDILIGDVWLCSGQSNMEWPIAASANPEQEIANANHPQIRHLKIEHTPMASAQEDVVTQDGWEVCSPETVNDFTAVGYFFGRKLQSELNVPIGLIGSNWGGTRIEPWTPPAGFRSVAALDEMANDLENYPEKTKDGKVNHQSALALYNGMIHPLIQLPIRGAIWYQGESNNGEGMLYRDKMEALIRGWREVWQQPQMPFYFVQLAPFRYGGENIELAYIWEAQLAAAKLPNTGMAVTVDISNLTDIHPKNKQDVGLRLALWALANEYKQADVVYSGPLFQSALPEGDKIKVTFDHAAGLKTNDGQAVSHLMVAGADKKFYPALGQINGDALWVSSPLVETPVAVRYAFHGLAEPNLVGGTGLPASPFRSDDWSDATVPADFSTLLGTWKFEFQTPDGRDVSHLMELSMSQDGQSVTGLVKSEQGEMKVDSVSRTDTGFVAKFKTQYENQPIDLTYECVVEKERLTGTATYDLGGQTGEFPIQGRKQ